MMHSDHIAIQTAELAKCYRIGLKEEIHDSIGGAFLEFIKSPVKNYRKYRGLYKFSDLKNHLEGSLYTDSSDIIWALKGVSFKINKGEVVGIIGRNGAGKSTLLKILSKITVPTKGQAKIRGRISSLIEVGTGFHQELTGRENVYLNGTILGMRKKEIDTKFDEIVAFSGVEKFIDTPVKRYSSGMKVRLAFAVAAHLEPEILLIDEVLAVGDSQFQKKCINKMEDVGQQGRTVLFVSHNMTAVNRLCQRTILLDDGKIFFDGPTNEVVSSYLTSDSGITAVQEWKDNKNAPGNEIVRLKAVRIVSEEGSIVGTIDIRNSVGIEMEYEVLQPDHVMLPYYKFYNEEGIRIFASVDSDPAWRGRRRPRGCYKSTAWIPGNLLSEGMVFVGATMKTTSQKYPYFNEPDSVAFQVIDNLDGDSARGDYAGKLAGAVRPLLKWETRLGSMG
jgi:lipopolysaccharide transport system ATP-binding protein